MSERCERCRKGYSAPIPRDDLEWPDGRPEPWRPGIREVRVARCTRCDSWLVDLWTTDAERQGVETHDVCVVKHDKARAAVLHRDPHALAAVAPTIRRRHLELLVSRMPTVDDATLRRIEEGSIATSEPFRGLVTRTMALRGEHPAIADVKLRGRDARAPTTTVGMKAPLDMGDGSRVLLDTREGKLSITRMRGDAVLWRIESAIEAREAFLGRVVGRERPTLLLLAAGGERRAAVCVIDAVEGTLHGPVWADLRVATFEAHALPSECIFVASYQASAVVTLDANVVWKGSSGGFPLAVPIEGGAIVTDAAWRLVSLRLPGGTERWSIPIDRQAAISRSGDGHILMSTGDVIARLEIAGDHPTLVWAASGTAALPLRSGGVAFVRERWERAGRSIECVVVDADGKRRESIARPDATKVPTAEIGRGVFLFHAGSDVTVTADGKVSYALALPDRKTPSVTVASEGVWIEYEGIVDFVDATGKRTGRWRVGL